MGNFLVLETLRQVALRSRAFSTKIDDVTLAAPDVDVDSFESELADMGSPHPKFTLFASRECEQTRSKDGLDPLFHVARPRKSRRNN